MQKTYFLTKKDLKNKWVVVDAKDKILGRLAVRVAVVLKGKHKPTFTPNVACGDGVIVINASKVRVTGRKLQQKVYRRYSGYPSGLKEVKLEEMLANKPATVIKLAVRRMLPQGPLGSQIMKKLKVYADDKHPHIAQKPQALEF